MKQTNVSKAAAILSVSQFLRYIGEDVKREGLTKTPERVVRSWRELFGGYRQNPARILRTRFAASRYDEMVACTDIEFFSTCEHHLLPFTGHAHIAYIPRGQVVGLSKMARLVECFARRLQIQERMTRQIAEAMQKALKPCGVGVVIEAKHFCMVCRGVRKQQSVMRTSALLGNFREPAVRQEFMTLVTRNGK